MLKMDEWLAQSRNPLILAGAGCLDVREKFYAFIERYPIPVMLTWKAMELLADDHPLYVGRPGAIGQVAANKILQECDFLLVLGAAMNYDQVAYQLEKIAPHAVKVVVDCDTVELDKYPAEWVRIHANLADVL